MTTSKNQQHNIVYFEEPPTKAPPLLAVGALAWIRDNLFSSWLDTLLTFLGLAFIITVITSFLQWSINQANWFAVIFNVRQFMVGRLESQAEWRIWLLVLIVAFAGGLAWAAWSSRISRSVIIVTVFVLALMFLAPQFIGSAIPLPDSHLVAGNQGIQAGSLTQVAQDQIAFIAKTGDIVTFRIADEVATDDETLAQLFSFSDNVANTLRNAAATSLSTQARMDEINVLLAGEDLTDRQRVNLENELGRIEQPQVITETYSINRLPVNLRILDGATLEPLVETILQPEGDTFSFTLPNDGWFVVEKTITEGEGLAILQTTGIFPILQRSFTRSEELDAGGEVVSEAGRVDQFVRMTDNFVLEAPQPQNNGTAISYSTIIEFKYRGERPLLDYLSLFLGPFLQMLNTPLLILVIAGGLGYVAGLSADTLFSPEEKPHRASQRAATWLLIATPALMFILVAGVGNILPLTDPRRWGGLLLTMMLTVVGIIGSFPIGVLLALGRRSSLPAVKLVCTLYIELVRGVPFISVLFMGALLLPLTNPALSEVPGAYRAMIATIIFSAAYLAENVRGGLQSIPPGQEEAAKAIGLNGLQTILYITLPQALRAVIPALVGMFIGLFKDTSLVAIVGLIDLTGITNSVVAQTEFLGDRRETFLFISIIYFVFSYVMSYVSRRIEASGAGAAMAKRI